jgi:hypothetical protein
MARLRAGWRLQAEVTRRTSRVKEGGFWAGEVGKMTNLSAGAGLTSKSGA